MTFIQAFLIGIIQGLTEFLPVSSSAHIVLVSGLYKLLSGAEITFTSSEEIFFDMVVHLGTLLAVFIYFKEDIILILKDFAKSIKTRDFTTPESKLPLMIILGTIITVMIAYPLKDIAEILTARPSIVGLLLVGTGIILILSDYVYKKTEHKKDISWKSAFITGIAQGLAALPGFSRSGLTISAGLFLGTDKVKIARYSFLLSIPIIIAASVFYPLLEIDGHEFFRFNFPAIFIGFITSAVSGYICIKYFFKFLKRYSLRVFAYYCTITGLLMFLFFGRI